jgi:hypothetical protein
VDNKKRYAIKVGRNKYVSRSDFGPFYGRISLVGAARDARFFGKISDAENRKCTMIYRIKAYKIDNKQWSKLNNPKIKIVEV